MTMDIITWNGLLQQPNTLGSLPGKGIEKTNVGTSSISICRLYVERANDLTGTFSNEHDKT
jgi:hypothetical protein